MQSNSGPRALSSLAALLAVFAGAGCADSPGGTGPSTAGGASDGAELAIDVPASGRAFVELGTPSVVAVDGDGKASTAWDIALESYDVFTNSGLSGPGEAGALGPYEPDVFESGVDPGSPILTRDAIGGAFFAWYAYDYKSSAHALYSRYHVFGVKDGARLWKVQILSYYGEVEGAPVSAMYRVRYAEVTPDGAPPTYEVTNIDGTAGGALGSDLSPSECLDLATGTRLKLSLVDALASLDWHLCFRRETISVNGELGGPRGVVAADLDGAKTPHETVQDLEDKTAASELDRFEAVTYKTLTDPGVAYRGDRVVSIFAGQWLDPSASPPAPLPSSWVVVGADGKSRSILSFARFEGASQDTPGRIILRVKPVVE